ncbi:hypothetical protein [Georgenia satyanarayanai]|uniref:hypothetical protein n=1 Tax=Georgenia satyanarayanai TaxID=860221 RepID=UPI001D029E80|nr:hypothetical protein [Georgenia satyanarayanai]
MALQDAGVIAGSVSTTLFVVSYLPMLVKAARTKDLRSYSPGNLVVANVGNLVHTVYVASLPPGPLWLLHGFYLASSALMLVWWWRFRPDEGLPPGDGRPGEDAADDDVPALELAGQPIG